MVNLAINGLGRIGRLAFRVATMHHADEANIVAVNTSGSIDTTGWVHLIKYDTTYKQFPIEIRAEEVKEPKKATDEDPLIGYIHVADKKIPVLAQRDPEKIPWGKYGAPTVVESTGIFIDEKGASKHIAAGARKVVISAPAKGEEIKTYVRGVNETGKEIIISNASCTTNCISPIAKIINDNFKIQKAMMTTVHGYTDDQRLQDNSHKDLRRARAAALNTIPTTTGAAIATTEVIPELKGKFDGIAIRVPVASGSLADFVFVTEKSTSIEEINKIFEEAAQNPQYQGIVGVTKEPIVSSDVIGQTLSTIVDLNFTNVIDGNLIKVLAWYDNEWGYTNRLVEQAIIAGQM